MKDANELKYFVGVYWRLSRVTEKMMKKFQLTAHTLSLLTLSILCVYDLTTKDF